MPDLNFFNNIEPLSITQIAEIGSCSFTDSSDVKISGVAPVDSAGANDITFLSNKKYLKALESSKAGACILAQDIADKAPDGMVLLISDNPYASYAKIAAAFYPDKKKLADISPTATVSKTCEIGINCTIETGSYIADNVKIGDNCYIQANAYINDNVQIGDNCRISHGATISHAILGSNIIIHPGVRIGQDGFGFAHDKGVHIKVPQLGRVIINDDVEIGANSCIDRGAGPDTIIGRGSKIDNLVQIGHNVQTGNGCIITAQCGVAGSTKLGEYVVLGGQAGVAGHLNVGSFVNVAAQGGVIQDVEEKQIVGGTPSVPIKQWHRQSIALKKLAYGFKKHKEA